MSSVSYRRQTSCICLKAPPGGGGGGLVCCSQPPPGAHPSGSIPFRCVLTRRAQRPDTVFMTPESKVVSIDIDGVCFDFSSAYASWLTKNGRPSFDAGQTSEFSLSTVLGITREQYVKDVAFMFQDEIDHPPIPGCQDTLNLLAQNDITLFLVTARIPEHHRATTAWVNRWNLPVEDVLCVGNPAFSSVDASNPASRSKLSACIHLGAQTHVDDQPVHLHAMLGSQVTPVAFGVYPWTQTDLWLHAPTWQQVPHVLQQAAMPLNDTITQEKDNGSE